MARIYGPGICIGHKFFILTFKLGRLNGSLVPAGVCRLAVELSIVIAPWETEYWKQTSSIQWIIGVHYFFFACKVLVVSPRIVVAYSIAACLVAVLIKLAHSF